MSSVGRAGINYDQLNTVVDAVVEDKDYKYMTEVLYEELQRQKQLVGSLQAEVRELKAESEGNVTQRSTVVAELKAEIAERDETIQEKAQENELLRRENERLLQTIKQITKHIVAKSDWEAQDEADTLRAVNDGLEVQVLQLHDERKQLRRSVEALKAEMRAQAEEISKLKGIK